MDTRRMHLNERRALLRRPAIGCGRATETGRGTIESVAEVAAAVKGQVPILVDGGIRRGSDVFKAITSASVIDAARRA